MGMRKVAAGMGLIIAIATALINLGIQMWQGDQQLVGAIFMAIGSILYIVASYYGLSRVKKAAVEEARDELVAYIDRRLGE